MLTDQHGACAICWESFENETPVIEHCHETGKVRGLTHQNCNAMIGLAKENPQILRLGALYIEKHKG